MPTRYSKWETITLFASTTKENLWWLNTCIGVPPPDLNGVDILEFLREPGNIESLKRGTSFVEEVAERFLYQDYDDGIAILDFVVSADATNPVRVVNSLDFANADVCCESAYVVDLDRSTFEVFQGYAKKKYAGSTRFANVGGPKDTVPRFVRSFDFNNLPPPEEFVKLFGDDDEGQWWQRLLDEEKEDEDSLLGSEEDDAEDDDGIKEEEEGIE
jgi:hypothetical protein